MSNRKYMRGEAIRSFGELEKQTLIMLHNKVLHVGFWGSWQYRMLKSMIDHGVLYKVEPVPVHEISVWDVLQLGNTSQQ